MTYALDGGDPIPFAGVPADARVLEWDVRDNSGILGRPIPAGWTLFRRDLATGHETRLRDISAPDPAGIRRSDLTSTAGGRYLLHSDSRVLVDLNAAEGLDRAVEPPASTRDR